MKKTRHIFHAGRVLSFRSCIYYEEKRERKKTPSLVHHHLSGKIIFNNQWCNLGHIRLIIESTTVSILPSTYKTPHTALSLSGGALSIRWIVCPGRTWHCVVTPNLFWTQTVKISTSRKKIPKKVLIWLVLASHLQLITYAWLWHPVQICYKRPTDKNLTPKSTSYSAHSSWPPIYHTMLFFALVWLISYELGGRNEG